MHNCFRRKKEIGDEMIRYRLLWERLKAYNVSQYRLKQSGISNSTLTRLKRDETITTDTINKLCHVLHCNVGDIMEYVEDE